MQDELKACPFCGGSNIATVQTDERCYMTCDDCVAEGPLANNEAEAITAWTTRADPALAAAEAEVARLERQVSLLRRKLSELGVTEIVDVDAHLAALEPRP